LDATPLNLVGPEVPVELAAIVAKMMAKEPERRFQTPAEVAKSLAPFFKNVIAGPRDSKTDVSLTVEPDARPNRSKSPWIWPTAAAAILLLGLYVAWAVVQVKSANGMIELVNLPKDALVLVDGAEVAVTGPGGGKPAVITATAGKHKIVVQKDGHEISGDEATVQSEAKETFAVRLIPIADLHPKNGDADDQTPRIAVAKSERRPPSPMARIPKPSRQCRVRLEDREKACSWATGRSKAMSSCSRKKNLVMSY
jgi:hypothetical protein